jgi:hypothetical protein
VIEKLLEHGANVNVLFEVAKDVTNEIVACMIPYEGQIAEDNINEWKKLRLRGLLF